MKAMKLWLTAAEIAELALPGLPGTKRNVNAYADASGWAERKALCRKRRHAGGGVEYALDLLPPDARRAYVARFVPEAMPLETAAAAEAEPNAAYLRDDAAEARDARLSILSAADRIFEQARLPRLHADLLTLSDYKAGRLGLPDWVRASVPKLTLRTLQRWRAAAKNGRTAALAVDRGASRRGSGILEVANDGAVRVYGLALIARQPHLSADHVRAMLLGRFGETLTVVNAHGVGRTVPLPPTEETRQFERDADADELVSQNTIKILARVAYVVVQAGPEAVTPVRPTIAADDCCIAMVRLSSTGFVEADIERYEQHRFKSVHEVEQRVASSEAEAVKTNREVATHKTDISNLSARIGNIPQPEIIYQLQRDTAMMRRKLQLPDEARASFYDPFLLPDQSDTAAAPYLASIREGIRFPNAAEREANVQLSVPDAASIKVASGILMPAWTERAAIVVEGGTGEKAISQVQHQVVNVVQRQIARESTEYGPLIAACENQTEWANAGLASSYPGQLLSHSGETFYVVGLSDHVNNSVPEYRGTHFVHWVRQLITRRWTETYWDYDTTTEGVNGSIYGQSFLNAQPCIATSLDLRFTQVDATGDVTLVICELNTSATPDLARAVIKVTKPAGQLVKGWNNFPYRPSLLTPGRRYGWVVITTGNHRLATASGNKFAQGSLFYSTDGAWFQGSTDEDFEFRLNVCQFDATRVEVPMQPMTLENGIAAFRLLTSGWEPGGTRKQIEIRVNDTWYPLAFYEQNPLNGLPALVQWRVVFTGTTDLMPAINMADAKITTMRPRNDVRWVSELWSFGLSSSQVVMETTVDTYDPDIHTLINRLMDGGTVLTPAATTVTIDPVRPSRRTFRSVFNLGAAKTGIVLRIEGDTDFVTRPYFVENLHAYVL